jgi:nucleotide-binding universal stress UspA family protein
MPFKRILCGVDFSADSLEAFRVAVAMARLHSGAIHLFHVMEAQPNVTGQALLQMIERANHALEGFVTSSRSSLDRLAFTSEVTSGEAAVEVVSRAREWRADLIVLGSKGITALEEIIIGGTAERVMQQAPCSVLVVRGRS